eukprot:1078927-Pelagomonas_calceolata.AAC.1
MKQLLTAAAAAVGGAGMAQTQSKQGCEVLLPPTSSGGAAIAGAAAAAVGGTPMAPLGPAAAAARCVGSIGWGCCGGAGTAMGVWALRGTVCEARGCVEKDDHRCTKG